MIGGMAGSSRSVAVLPIRRSEPGELIAAATGLASADDERARRSGHPISAGPSDRRRRRAHRRVDPARRSSTCARSRATTWPIGSRRRSPSFAAARRQRCLASVDGRRADPAPGVFIPPWWARRRRTHSTARPAFLPGPAARAARRDRPRLHDPLPERRARLLRPPRRRDPPRQLPRPQHLPRRAAATASATASRPAAVIPTHTPDEAIAELDHAVEHLGFKAAVLNSYVVRTDSRRPQSWTDVLALDSPHDYDPLWQRFVDLGVAVTVHSPSQGLALRQSSSPLHVQPHRQLRREQRRVRQGAGVRRRAAPVPDASTSGSSSAAWRGACSCCATSSGGGRSAAADTSSSSTRRASTVDEWDTLARPSTAAPGSPTRARATRRCSPRATTPPPERDDFRDAGVARRRRHRRACSTASSSAARPTTPRSAGPSPTDVNPLRCGAAAGARLRHRPLGRARHAPTSLPEAYELVEDGRLDADQFRRLRLRQPDPAARRR